MSIDEKYLVGILWRSLSIFLFLKFVLVFNVICVGLCLIRFEYSRFVSVFICVVVLILVVVELFIIKMLLVSSNLLLVEVNICLLLGFGSIVVFFFIYNVWSKMIGRSKIIIRFNIKILK